ncbi:MULTISPECIES: hypothetical protein [Peptoniphilus]|jgi:hypothetical protein|uniref:hypothetical protein n=1 Tax=Peptoniphilus TaxID=162289 RepID=UPI000288468A|nr:MULTISPECIES: hypothetical protein [Peptoniphilus]MBS6610521.1 hypothetical protein [Peptoniphilus harei]MDU1954907.1 hypothetical protein [Peptoniphilus lacydonensis]MDU2114722.1 hypothetical protein [Peptoniphilus lacydonensis]MDU5274285.1 hypothetical protein [Peptoniphilus lacydonensis]MDU5377486.1 hypothetical protein [Peptoniphilus lacydonensis]
MFKNRKILFIILFALDLFYTYCAITGVADFFHRFRGPIYVQILWFVVICAPAIVHYLPGGTKDNLKESRKYTIPLFVIIAINIIIPMYVK